MITFLQNVQGAHPIKGDRISLFGWYHNIKSRYAAQFDWALFDTSAGLRVVPYVDGVAQLEGPNLEQPFTGHVVGVGTTNFTALLLAGPQGQPAGNTISEMHDKARSLGLPVQTPVVIACGKIDTLLESLEGADSALLLPALSAIVGILGQTNRRAVAAVTACVLKAVTPVAEPVVEVTPVEETLPPEPEEETPAEESIATGVTDEPEPDHTATPKAVITGGFRYPQEHYKPQLEKLGYEVVPSDNMTELPADIDLVLFPMRSKKTKLVSQAEERSVATWTTSDLSEKLRAKRIRSGG